MELQFPKPRVNDLLQNPRVILDVIMSPEGHPQLQIGHFNCENGWPQAVSIIAQALPTALDRAFVALTEEKPMIEVPHNLPFTH